MRNPPVVWMLARLAQVVAMGHSGTTMGCVVYERSAACVAKAVEPSRVHPYRSLARIVEATGLRPSRPDSPASICVTDSNTADMDSQSGASFSTRMDREANVAAIMRGIRGQTAGRCRG